MKTETAAAITTMNHGEPEVISAEPLTRIERENLEELEGIIQKSMAAFYEVGMALLQIKESKLYREEYVTFDHYCKEKWNMSRQYAYRLIASAEVADNLSPMGDIPDSERVVRPLTKIKDPDQRREVYRKARETAPEGKVTAKHIEKTLNETVGKREKYSENTETPIDENVKAEQTEHSDKDMAPPDEQDTVGEQKTPLPHTKSNVVSNILPQLCRLWKKATTKDREIFLQTGEDLILRKYALDPSEDATTEKPTGEEKKSRARGQSVSDEFYAAYETMAREIKNARESGWKTTRHHEAVFRLRDLLNKAKTK